MNFIDTPTLRIGYEELNRDGARTAICLHGWPDSLRTWTTVSGKLAEAGWRVLVPAVRGFAPTTFRDQTTMRSGQLSALGCDVLDFIDALGLGQPALIGHDWGARAAANACGLRPGVASHLVMLSVGYGTNNPDQKLSMDMLRNYWYHWLMATPRGDQVVRNDGRAFAKFMWDSWSPPGPWNTSNEFDATASAFDHPDWADVTLHSYRHRWGHAEGDPAYDHAEAALNPAPLLDVDTLVIHGNADRVNPPETSAGREHFFTGRYQRIVCDGIGHCPQREAPESISDEVIRFLGEA
jgi:pimeloyl-ACP methyl ester carboxylesterase